MLSFVFLLTMYTETGTDVYVMDSAMTGVECIEAMTNYNDTSPEWSRGNPSCEIDAAVEFAE